MSNPTTSPAWTWSRVWRGGGGRRAIAIGCIVSVLILLGDTFTEELRGPSYRESHGFTEVTRPGRTLEGANAFRAGKWFLPVAVIVLCLYCAGLERTRAPRWTFVAPLAAVVALAIWQVADYLDTKAALEAEWKAYSSVVVTPPGGPVRLVAFGLTVAGFGAWLLWRSRPRAVTDKTEAARH
jgi:hypothetical protein